MKKALYRCGAAGAAVIAAALLAGAGAAAQQPQEQPAPLATQQQIEDIVVTGRRSGIPVWHVHGPMTSVVLVGAINGVTKDTRWDPGALTEALRKADRVLFPESIALTASPFAAIGYLAKWRAQASLPKGQSLQQMMPPEQFARLVALQRRGVIPEGFERKHPLHLAMTLRGYAKGKSGEAEGASGYVSRAVKKYKLNSVPMPRRKAKGAAQDLFKAPPQTHIRCLLDSVALVEAGPGAVQARSHAWSQRRVPAVLNSPAEKPHQSCWPANLRETYAPEAQVRATVRGLLAQPKVTVAVLNLHTLGKPGGLLDDLERAGFEVQGPRWK
jgi:uncharacterized protein YbaP (TraB family)